ncbi:MAG: XdhC family protein [Pyrinomonadaceae bacterium]
MRKELELWQFIHDRIARGGNVILLIVAESSGSSPGRAGYKMAVSADGELYGSVGGGVMEVNLVEEARRLLSEPGAIATGFRECVHQTNSPNASGMICSGRQTVIIKRLGASDLETVQLLNESDASSALVITRSRFGLEKISPKDAKEPITFSKDEDGNFHYRESLFSQPALYILGGGHCALALSELMVKLGFYVTIFDDRPELNTIAKNEFADEISIISNYENVSKFIPIRDDIYIVVMTLGYASDKVVIKGLSDRNFKYFGVLGSKAKMATLLKELKGEGIPDEQLARIRTPIGIPINSHTPEEIAVSIAAEIISVKNSE